MDDIVVSIVTPAYNQAQFLREAIESVLSQDYPYIEYLVLDDGSSDDTRQVLASYSGRLHWETQPNMGQARTLNKGWTRSKGHILGYLSADDVLYPGAVRRAVEVFSSEPDVVLVYPDCDLIDPYSRLIRRSVARLQTHESLVVDQDCYIGPGAFFRRWVYETEGGWDPRLRLGPDREFYMRIGLHGRITMIPKVLAAYRMHPQSVSVSGTQREVASEHVEVIHRFFQRPDIPTALQRRRAVAFSRAHYIEARIHIRGGRILECVRSLKKARKLDPQMSLRRAIVGLSRASVSRIFHIAAWTARQLAHSRGAKLLFSRRRAR